MMRCFKTRDFKFQTSSSRLLNLNLDGARFDQCLDSGEEIATVKKDSQEGQRLGCWAHRASL